MSFEIITIDELLMRLDKYNHKELHVHHTWKPEHKDFNGSNGLELQQGMKNYHVNTLKWSDIGQHVTLLPNGLFITGRDFAKTPASISGYNTGGFACEMLGNFDIGHDVLEGDQKNSILRLAKYFDDKKKYIRFHRENAAKTCPGTSIDKNIFMNEVRNYGNTIISNPTPQPQPVKQPTKAPIKATVRVNAKVLAFQKACNKLGIRDKDGHKLVEDGLLGNHSLQAAENIGNINKGDKNVLVSWIQSVVGCTQDGSFGSITESKVIAFQKAHSLKADGVVGKNTARVMLQHC